MSQTSRTGYLHKLVKGSLLRVAPLCLLLCGQVQAEVAISAAFESRLLPSLQVDLNCGVDHPDNHTVIVDNPGRFVLQETWSSAPGARCQVRADLPLGYSVSYRVEGGADSSANRNGCRFAQPGSGEAVLCHFEITQNPVKLMVYKKWIGGSGEEQDVRVSLDCESGDYSGFRYVNEGAPDGWEIRNIDPEGILCNVSEKVRENFEADIIDCQGLYVLPGKGEECTLLNTKIVKRIEMLNRYGRVIMIILILGVGLLAMRRFN